MPALNQVVVKVLEQCLSYLDLKLTTDEAKTISFWQNVPIIKHCIPYEALSSSCTKFVFEQFKWMTAGAIRYVKWK